MTPWRGTQSTARDRHLAHYDPQEVDRYEAWMLALTEQDDLACLADIAPDFQFQPEMSVLDVGAGTGVMCKVLARVPGLAITALEPSSPMIDKLTGKPELSDVKVVQGFCDSAADRALFDASSFDAIVSRQVTNGLFDPLTAFRNWQHWLKPGGTVVVMDGLFDRSAWTGALQNEVDVLPLSACQSTAMIPYLLETVGFTIVGTRLMEATNSLPTTRTEHYVVIARNLP